MYRAKVTETASGQTETYTGVTGNTFKERWYGHKSDFRRSDNRTKSRLAGHVWTLKDERKTHKIEWELLERGPAYNPITRKCRICLKEKREIMYNREGSSLNKRNEVFNTCRHRHKKILANFKT